MPNPNTFECKACGATFDSKDQLDNHNRREHPSGSTVGAGAGKGSTAGKGTSGSSTPGQKKNM